MPKGLHHVGIDVADLDASVAFYEALGFEASRRMEGERGMRIAFMTLGELTIELFSNPFPLPPCPEERTCGMRHVSLVTDDLDGEIARLQAKGLLGGEHSVIRLPHGARFIELRDPDGVGITLMQD